MTSRDAPRAPGVVQAITVTILAAVVAALARTAHQPPPPTVAELAPQAVQRIQQSPREQALDAGSSGGPAAGSAETTSTTSPRRGSNGGRGNVDLPRVRRCVGDPPRQTEDPQSPPCVPYFAPDADNGGGTAPGVTANEIHVVFWLTFGENADFVTDLAEYFNKRYEFYNRKLVLTVRTATATDNGQPESRAMIQDADAVTSDPKYQYFATLNYVDRRGAEHEFYDEMARRGVISVSHRAQSQSTEAHLRSYAPYEWSYLPGADTMLRNIGQFACSTLAGQPARYAGARSSSATRKFGIIRQVTADGTKVDLAPLLTEFRRCGQPDPVVEDDQESTSSTRTTVAIVNDLASQNVTSVICVCDIAETRNDLMPAASAQAYQPEWLLSTYIDNDVDNAMNGAPTDQASHVIGVTFRNKLLPRDQMPWYWALKESKPADAPQPNDYYSQQARYSSLLLLASGIQMAGPHLTPQTFQAALWRTQWANPNAGSAPYWQARVGFDGNRHTMIDDGSLYWYDPAQPGTVDPSSPGAICHVLHGARFGAGRWPKGDPGYFFGTNPCM